MIEKLKKEDVEKAARFYNKGTLKQIPPHEYTLNETIDRLGKLDCFVYNDNGMIKGIVIFQVYDNGNLKLDFIYASEMRKGIGKELIKRVASFALRKGLKNIISEVSEQDTGVMAFYESCGFEKYGKHKVDKEFTLILVKATPKNIKERLQ